MSEPQLLTVIEKDALQQWPHNEWAHWQIEPKRDGFRMLIVDGKVQSRSGKPLYNYQHILDELGEDLQGVVLDGEFHGATWEETSQVARASKSERSVKLLFTVFDMLSLQEWQKQVCEFTLWQRQERLRSWLRGQYTRPHVKIVEPFVPNSGVNPYEYFEALYKLFLTQGCDGLVLKRMDSMYEFKRTKTWLKVKPVLECDAVVVGMEQGEGKHKGRMGKLLVKPEGSEVVTGVGTGFTDEQREMFWNGAPYYEGVFVQVEYRKVNPSGKLVEPRFVRVRDDK